MSNKQHSQVSEILNSLRPAMEADGGGVELNSIEDGTVFVKLKGTCLACPSASMTMKFGIERTLKEKIPWIRQVVRVG